MYEHKTRHDSSDAKVSRPARAPQGADLSAAGNRAMRDVLATRPVQRWPDLDDLGGLLGGGPSMGDPTPDLGGYMPSLPSLPSMPDLGGLLPSMPSMPQLNIPGVNLNVDTDRGTASGGIDFHDGTSGNASYGPGGVDFSGQSGNTSLGGHASASNSWNVHGATKTPGGTSLGGALSDDHGAFSGAANLVGAGGDVGSLGGTFGRGATTGFGSYAGQYGNLDLGF
jgi:hypothetical protein